MKLNRIQYNALIAENDEDIQNSGIAGMNFRWDGNEMPYDIDKDTFNVKEQQFIKNTIAKINSKTCGCFKIR